ncbi:POC1 centriolar protein homolog [Argiope bruennichi]|uniref:POC1 centriolar protein homolog n=1 Tax=Argiope bruennichi TaxID=94029 RepID=UPI0024953107|nr:POC1 centriolar protein homolog [Argiope bruennichi]
MKRQSVGIRRGSGESRSQINETKRLKVAHSHEDNFQNNELEAGSGSDSTEEYININGQDKNLKYSMMVEENSPAQKFSEINHESLLHASVSTTEESSTAGYHVNGKYSEENEMPVLMPEDTSNKTFANGSEEIADEENFSVISHSNIVASSNISKLPENTVAETNGMLQENVLSPITNKQTKTQINADKSEFNCPASENMEQQNCEADVQDSSPLTETSHCSNENPVDNISIPTDDQKGSCSSSYQESDIQSMDEKVATVSKVSFDVENITLCQLQVTLLEGHADVVFGVDADEDFVLSSSGDTTVKVWNVEDKKEISNFAGHNAAVTSVILLSSEESETLRSKLNCFQTSRIAVSASYDCHIRLWSVLDGHEILSMYTFNSIMCMDYLKDHNYVVVGTEGGKLEVWDLHLAKLVHFVYAHDSSVSSLKIHDCYVYSSSKDGTVKVWLFDEEELQPLYTRRRKEIIPGTSDFGPTQWQAVAVHNDVLFLGDNTSCLKTLDWRIGRLRLHLNQPDACGVCEAVLVKDNILLTSFFDVSSDTGGINVWKLPEMIYVGTLTGDLQEICSLALVRSKQKLRIVSGGHQLVVWDFDFSKPPQKGLQDPFFVCEADKIGSEVNEVEMLSPTKAVATPKEENTANKKSWCNIS